MALKPIIVMVVIIITAGCNFGAAHTDGDPHSDPDDGDCVVVIIRLQYLLIHSCCVSGPISVTEF